MKRMLLVLAIVGMLVMPMMAAKVAITLQKGDIILSQGGKWDKWARNFAYRHYRLTINWTHAACYAGDIYYSKSVIETTRDGYLDVVTLQHEKNTHKKLLYLRVNVGSSIKEQAVQFMADKTFKIGHEIHLYDLWSLLHNTKQVDGSPGTLGWRYHCSEIVWAGYRSQWINLDPEGDDTIVWPDDLERSPYTIVIGYWEKP